MSKKTQLALTVALAVGGGLPAPLSGIFFIAAIIAFFKLILRVLDDAGEAKPDMSISIYVDDLHGANSTDALTRQRYGAD